MLPLLSILCFALAFACLANERWSRAWYLERWLLAFAGFWFALGVVAAIGWMRSFQ